MTSQPLNGNPQPPAQPQLQVPVECTPQQIPIAWNVFAPDNTRIDHKGGRVCVACKRERDARSKRERYAKARTAA